MQYHFTLTKARTTKGVFNVIDYPARALMKFILFVYVHCQKYIIYTTLVTTLKKDPLTELNSEG